jgi:predicted transcriptional regulator of viral defense system
MTAKLSQARQRLSHVLRNTSATFTVSQVAKVLDLQPVKASKMLSRWVQQGWVVRLRRGLYAAVPLKSSGGEMVLENPWLVVPALFEHAYIGGWSAAEHWDLTEQIFSSVCVLTSDKIRRKDQSVGGVRFILTSMREDRHFGLRFEWVGNQRIAVSDPERTVVDMFYKPSLGGGIQHVTKCLRNLFANGDGNINRLADYADRFKSGAANKRLGLIAEVAGLDELARSRFAHKSAGNVQLDPRNPGDKLVTRWGVWVPRHWE